jgi:hypothetical protein
VYCIRLFSRPRSSGETLTHHGEAAGATVVGEGEGTSEEEEGEAEMAVRRG